MIFCKFSWSSCSISSLNSLPDGSTNFEKSFVAFILSIAVHLRDWLDAMFACPVKKHTPESQCLVTVNILERCLINPTNKGYVTDDLVIPNLGLEPVPPLHTHTQSTVHLKPCVSSKRSPLYSSLELATRRTGQILRIIWQVLDLYRPVNHSTRAKHN